MRRIKIELPWPPTVNTMFATFKGRRILSAAGRKYRAEAIAIAKLMGVCDRVLSRLSVSITAYPPDRRKRDLDNLLKAPLDAMTHAGVWDDDSQIDKLSIARGEIRKGGGITVIINTP